MFTSVAVLHFKKTSPSLLTFAENDVSSTGKISGTNESPLIPENPVGPTDVPTPVLGSIVIRYPAELPPNIPTPPYSTPSGPNSNAPTLLNPIGPISVGTPAAGSMV